MVVESIPLASVHADPANVRRHPQRNLDAIMASLARFGQQKPIVIDQNGICRAGNGTLAAAKALGWATINVVRTILVGTEATAYAIADNRTAELAEWDSEALAKVLAVPDMGDLGFTPDELEALSAAPGALDPAASPPGESFQVIVECESEQEQQEVYEQLNADGHRCRVLTL